MDGIQNQGEEGIDCGGPCKSKCEKIPKIENLIIEEKALVVFDQTKYDVLIKVNNPNSSFGIANFDYIVELVDREGKVLSRKNGSSFILPDQTKYIVEFNFDTQSKPSGVEFKIRSFKWSRFVDYQQPFIDVYSKNFNLVSSGGTFATLKAIIENKSDYDFEKVNVIAVIRNEQGVPVAVNQTGVQDMQFGDKRDVVFNWTKEFNVIPESSKIEIQPDTNIFINENFMKKFGTPDRYQSLGYE